MSLRRTLFSIMAASAVLLLTVGAARAGEVTGNGKLLHVESSKWGTGLHARSVCAFSGQEDLQFFTNSGKPKEATKGVPTHAQSWGQIPKVVRDQLATDGLHPGMACNPMRGANVEP
jgi:hypothetical protein